MEGLADEFAKEHLDRVQIKAEFISAACPFHAERTPGAFWINRESGSWGCFGCGAGGRDLLELMYQLGVGTPRARAKLEEAREEAKKHAELRKARGRKKAKQTFKGQFTLPDALLGVYDWTPVDLVDEGFSKELLAEHQIGYDRANERVTWPIRDIDGNLIGISGRRADGEWGPKYKFYEGWHESRTGERVPGELGEWYPNYSSTGIRDHLWRGERVFYDIYNGKTDQLVVVEGFKAALWLVQCGYTNTVAIMGSKMSQQQERLIRRMGTPTWILLDANYAGRRGSRDACWRLADATFPVYECHYPMLDYEDLDEGLSSEEQDSRQPDDLSEEELEYVLSSAKQATRSMRKRKKYGQASSNATEPTGSKRSVSTRRRRRKKLVR